MASIEKRLSDAVYSNYAAVRAYDVLSIKNPGEVYVVGGAVRDAVLEVTPKDIDLLVVGLSEEQILEALTSDGATVRFDGKSFGVFRVTYGRHMVELACARQEKSTGPTHQEFDVIADGSVTLEEDLLRRDFTINAMAYDIANDKIVDLFGGRDDINMCMLRAVSDKAFEEDPLRIVRALVISARYGFWPDCETFESMTQNSESIRHLAPERIQAELDKLFAADKPAAGIILANASDVLSEILPEVDACFGFDQNSQWHEFELGDHLCQVLTKICEVTEDIDLRLAALLHDIGKPACHWIDPETGRSHYYAGEIDGEPIGADHELVGADMTHQLMTRLRYPNDRVIRVTKLVRNHMFSAFTTKKGARKFINSVGYETAGDLMDLRWADQNGKQEYPNSDLTLADQLDLITAVREHDEPTKTSDLVVSGRDLIASGLPEGPIIGKALSYLTDIVLCHPEYNTRERLLSEIQGFEGDWVYLC